MKKSKKNQKKQRIKDDRKKFKELETRVFQWLGIRTSQDKKEK
jgi:hypothetical protein